MLPKDILVPKGLLVVRKWSEILPQLFVELGSLPLPLLLSRPIRTSLLSLSSTEQREAL